MKECHMFTARTKKEGRKFDRNPDFAEGRGQPVSDAANYKTLEL
jgi:hypothetical protein